MLQLDQPLLAKIQQLGFATAIETNGTIPVLPGIDWITVSPKPDAELLQQSGTELKLVYPAGLCPEDFAALSFNYFFLSPLWTADKVRRRRHMLSARDYCLVHPQWRLSLQAHRDWELP